MELKKCTDWFSEKFIKATCPYCDKTFKQHGVFNVGDKITCLECRKKFILRLEK